MSCCRLQSNWTLSSKPMGCKYWLNRRKGFERITDPPIRGCRLKILPTHRNLYVWKNNRKTKTYMTGRLWDQTEKTFGNPILVNVRYMLPIDLIRHLSCKIDKEARSSTAKFFLSYARVGSGLRLQVFLQEENLSSSASMRYTSVGCFYRPQLDWYKPTTKMAVGILK